MAEKWITAVEATRLSGYTRKYFYTLLDAGKIKARRFGRAWMVDRASVLVYVREAKQRGNKTGPKPKGAKHER